MDDIINYSLGHNLLSEYAYSKKPVTISLIPVNYIAFILVILFIRYYFSSFIYCIVDRLRHTVV